MRIISRDKMYTPFFNFEQPTLISSTKYYQLYQCKYDSHYFHSDLFKQLSIICPPNINKSVKTRQAEYLAGRFVAHFALNLLGFPTTGISSGADREPLWPDRVLGSITHTSNKALCAVATRAESQWLGIDMAQWIDTEVSQEIAHLIITTDEIKLFRELSWSKNHALTFAFSAKESLFKALFPIVKRYFDFSAAILERVCIENGTFRIRLTESLTNELTNGFIFEGIFYLKENEIVTIIAKPF